MTVTGPRLDIQQLGSDVILSWPTNAVGYALVTTTQMSAAANWQQVLAEAVVVGQQNVVTNAIVPSGQYYTLQYQQ
jgi:hypothetical protein